MNGAPRRRNVGSDVVATLGIRTELWRRRGQILNAGSGDQDLIDTVLDSCESFLHAGLEESDSLPAHSRAGQRGNQARQRQHQQGQEAARSPGRGRDRHRNSGCSAAIVNHCGLATSAAGRLIRLGAARDHESTLLAPPSGIGTPSFWSSALIASAKTSKGLAPRM